MSTLFLTLGISFQLNTLPVCSGLIGWLVSEPPGVLRLAYVFIAVVSEFFCTSQSSDVLEKEGK